MSETTASITCTNGGSTHTHHSTLESRACYGLVPASALPVPPLAPSGPFGLSVPDWHSKPVSERQLWKLEQLGGKACAKAARYLTRGQASAVIDELLHPEKEIAVSQPVQDTPPPPPVRPARPVDVRHEMIAGLLPVIKDGYYAVHEYEGGHVDFLRVSRPKKHKWNGCIKIQTVHGSVGGVKLKGEPIAALWPSGSFSVYDRSGAPERMLMLLVADPTAALRRYAKLLGHCCRCNASLTDDRSRHYGIGPECEKYWPHIIEAVNAEDALANAL
jgi:hypothetical protein